MEAIKRSAKLNEQYEHACTHNQRLDAIGRNTQWHNMRTLKDRQQAIARSQKQSQDEINHALKELKVRRNERLKKLYQRDAQSYETKLAAMGLSILKISN